MVGKLRKHQLTIILFSSVFLFSCQSNDLNDPDKLEGRQISASSSNRNFKGRQGSASGRTLLMSPAMVAAAAINGKVTDVRKLLQDSN